MNAPNQLPASAKGPIDLDLLASFVAIADTGSFSKAAQRVFRTPSAVSMQIKKLEETLGKSVFARDSRSVSLTSDGEMLLGYARRMLALSNEMMARFVMPEMTGTVCLGAPDDYGTLIMPQLLSRFAETHPNVSVNVIIETSDHLIPRFDRGQLDVMVYTPQNGMPLDHGEVQLLEENLVWAGVKGGCAWERDPLPLSMWEACCPWRQRAVEALTGAGRSYRTAYMSAHTLAQKAAIESDLAVAPFPASFMEPPLIALGEKEGLPELGTYQIRMRKRDKDDACAGALADHILACFEQLVGGEITYS